MALRIRLARAGAKKRPFYRIVVAESTAPRDGRFIERVGSYNPLLPRDHEDRVTFDADRVRHWLGEGARPTDRVARFLGQRGLIEPPVFNNPQKGLPGARALERRKAEERAEEEARAAAEAPAEAADASADEAGEGAEEAASDAASQETQSG